MQTQNLECNLYRRKGEDGGDEEWYEVRGDEVEEDVGMATLFVHALEGNFGVDTIRILGCHKDRQLVIYRHWEHNQLPGYKGGSRVEIGCGKTSSFCCYCEIWKKVIL